MKYLIPTFFLCLLLTSCEYTLESNERGRFRATVIDADGIPVSGAVVTVGDNDAVVGFPTGLDTEGSFQFKFTPPDQDAILGSGVSNSDGEVDFLILSGGNFLRMGVEARGGQIFGLAVSDGESDSWDLEIPAWDLKQSFITADLVNVTAAAEVPFISSRIISEALPQVFNNGRELSVLDNRFDNLNFIVDEEEETAISSVAVYLPAEIEIQIQRADGTSEMTNYLISDASDIINITY